MSKAKEIFSQIREEELEKELIQERIFIASDEEEAYEALKQEANKEIGKIINITKEEEKTNPLPF